MDLGSSNGISQSDRLKLSAWTLGMYKKCVLLDSKSLVLQNCDELFNMKEAFSATHSGTKNTNFDDHVIVMKPSIMTCKMLLELKKTGKFSDLESLLNAAYPNYKRLPPIYNYNTSQISKNLSLDEVKIFSFKDVNILDGKVHVPEAMKKVWMSFFNELPSEISTLPHTPMKDIPMDDFAELNNLNSKKNHYRDAIAIVGHSCRFPGANNSDEFWNLLITSGHGIIPCPQERILDDERDNPKYMESKAGFLKCPIDEFDAKFFGISRREAAFMDPQQRLLVEVAWEALENAAINPLSLKGTTTGVFSGVWTHDYEHLLVENTTSSNFNHIVLGNAFSATSARVSYFLGLNGPNVATESGCSSSLGALHLACESLRRGETPLALVLGANIIVSQITLSEVAILAKDAQCKTFDESADGFGRAEGVAVIVVKRLSDAIKNGDRVMGIVRGCGMSQEGTTSSFGTPSKHCQEIAIREAIKNSGVNPRDVDYVEAHGTGTPVGDPIEFAALSAAYSDGEREKPLIVGSVKTNTGHTESAAGLAGIIKIILSMKHEIIPPHRNFTTINPNINLDIIPAMIPVKSVPWPRNAERVRIAGVSSFGISGTNVHAILEEPPSLAYVRSKLQLLDSKRSHHILTFSAKSEIALKDLSAKYIEYFENNPNLDIADVTFTANNGKGHLKYRQFVIGNNIKELRANLQENGETSPVLLNTKPRIAFLFTGQGSQYFGMAKDLYACNLIFRNAFRQCSEMIKSNLEMCIENAMWKDSEGEVLNQTLYSQLSIFTVEYSLLKFWESLGVKPDFVLGHSVGEFCAAVAARILKVEDAIKLLCKRSKLIQELPGGGMLAVHCSKEEISDLIEQYLSLHSTSWLDIAVVNSPVDVVIAGEKNTIENFKEFCTNNGKKSTVLAAGHAFHSRAVEGAMDEFGQFADTITYQSPQCNYISGTTGTFLKPDELKGSYWTNHARQTVNFSAGIKSLCETDCNVFIEIGSHPVLLALGMKNILNSDNHLWLPSLRRNESDWKTILQSLGTLYSNGVDVKWGSLDKSISRRKVELPSYPFQRQKYWTEITKEYLGRPLHPLLGRKVLIAGVKDIIYENTWNMQDMEYLLDHQVANLAVLPAAAHLETIIAAGKDIFLTGGKNKNSTLKVENLSIDCPLELDEERKYKVQIIASPVANDSNSEKYIVKVFIFQNLNGYNDEKGWKQYSSAFVSVSDMKSPENPNAENHIKENIDEVISRCPKEMHSQEYYKLATEIGIHFGNAFQAVATVFIGQNETVSKIPLPTGAGRLNDYVFHPIVLDSMLQTFGLSLGKQNTSLYLPVGIDRFVMLGRESPLSSSQYFYTHVKWEQGKTIATITLYSEAKCLLAIMEGVRLLQTSASAFLNVINAQKNLLPGMYQEIWKIKDGPLESRIDLKQINSDNILDTLNKSMEKHMENLHPEIELLEDELIGLSILAGFIQTGWNPTIGEMFDVDSLIQDLLFSYSYSSFVGRILEIICQDGYSVEIETENEESKAWKIIKQFPTVEQINSRQRSLLETIYSKFPDGQHDLTDIAVECSKILMKVMQGKESAVSALFGTKGLDPLDLYTKSVEVNLSNMRMAKFIDMALKELKPGGKQEGAIVRVIEIGAGSGSTSKKILKTLQNSCTQFRYTFTDISQYFLEGATKELSSFSGVDYGILDIEKDPASQGYCPNHYDIVIAANVIHATKSLNNSVHNVRRLLAPNGFLLMQEMLKPVRRIDVFFGVLDGFWKFSDYELRKSHPTASKRIWDSVFLENNFSESNLLSSPLESTSVLATRANSEETVTYKAFNSENAILHTANEKKSARLVFCDEGNVHKDLVKYLSSCKETLIKIKSRNNLTNELGSKDTVFLDLIDVDYLKKTLDDLNQVYNIVGIIYLYSLNNTDGNADEIYQQTLNLCKYLSISIKAEIQICIVTRGIQFVAGQEKVHPDMAPVVGMIKSLANELLSIRLKLIDLDPDTENESNEAREIFYELISKDESSICFRNCKRLTNRLITLPKATVPLSLPHGRYRIDIPKSKKIDDVCFKGFNSEPLLEGQAEVLLKATALNFRDVYMIMKPDAFKSTFTAVGTEFSGVISRVGSHVSKFKVGDEVFGFFKTSCAASHVVVPANMLIHKPKQYTFAEASTLPFVFFTAWHCLVDVANLKKGETVLIHVASGGVGLIAIQIAKSIGANIIATAGTHRKRNYLRSIGIEHVFNSRDLHFGCEIEKVTKGKGVDVVLNSLTGQGFIETSLKVSAKGARFVEMAKVNIWGQEEMEKVRSDVKYTIVDMEPLDGHWVFHLMDMLELAIKNNIISPLPYSRFEIAYLRDALNYMVKAEHIGKIVVAMPEAKEINGSQFNNDLLFNSNSSYLITGGLGGIGLEVAKWMVDSGARNIILVGRSKPTEKTLQVLNSLKSLGCSILCMQVDIGNMAQCRKLFDILQNPDSRLPPLKGVIHSAGTLSDAVFANQSWEKYQTVFNSKVNGGWNLHNLTKEMNLEHFVLFSSMAAMLSPIGQSNHAAANMFLDSLAHYRNSMGLPAQTVNWGAWSEIGAAVNSVYGNEGNFGVKPFTPTQGIATLKFMMTRPNLTQLGVIQIDVGVFKQSNVFNSGIVSLLEDEAEGENPQLSAAQSEKFISEISSLSFEERIGYFKTRLESIIRKTLKLSENETIDEHQQFSELGLDSLMAVEMKNKLQQLVGKSVTLNSTSLLDYPTTHGLSTYLAEATMTIEIKPTSTTDNGQGQEIKSNLEKLVKQDCQLPRDIQNVNDSEKDFKNILLTGSTGQIGCYILKDLSQIPNLENIYCLIRGKSVDHVTKKLRATLKKFQLTEEVKMDKIKFVAGNITEDRFGLSIAEYKKLSEKIQCVFHLAAKVNHVELYQVTKSNADIRSVNVLGTVNVLRFCSNVTTKRVIFASSYPAINRLTSDGFASDEFPESDNYGDGITEGYFLSKFICEKLLKEAISRGVPCTCIRYPVIVGNSQTGHFTVETNLLMNLALVSSRMGIFPDIKGGLNCLPVDTASKLTMELVFNQNANPGMYNLLHTSPMYSKDIVNSAIETGFDMILTSEDEYFKAFDIESETNIFLSLFTEQYGKDMKSAIFNFSDTLKMSLLHEKNIYRFSERFLKVIPDVHEKIPQNRDVLKLYFEYAKRSGVADKFRVLKM